MGNLEERLRALLFSWGAGVHLGAAVCPANRIGNEVYSPAQLKTMQKVITLVVFALFSFLSLKEPLGWNHLVGFALITGSAAFIFHKF